jgi:hypothetical protein
METRQQVNTFLVNYECDECEDGNLEYSEMLLPSTWGGCISTEQPKWKHKCDICLCEKNLETKYPYTSYEYY